MFFPSNGEDDCFPSSVDSLANSFKTMDLSSHESEKNTKMAGNTHQNSILAARRDRKRIPQQKEFDFWDTPAYASDIYDYLREAEVSTLPLFSVGVLPWYIFCKGIFKKYSKKFKRNI